MGTVQATKSRSYKLACLIVGRNLGDAVIQSKFLRQLIERGYAERFVVWTRPQVAFLYQSLPNCEVVTSPFPVGTSKQFDREGFFQFLRALKSLRMLKPEVTLDLIGDFRERLFARLIGTQPHQYIGWAPGHPFAKIIRNPFGAPSPVCTIPATVESLYEGYQIFIDKLAPTKEAASAGRQASNNSNIPRPGRRRVGLHPFASQDCKLWPDSNWRELAIWLQTQNIAVTVYGAPFERDALVRIFGELEEQPEYFTKSIPELDPNVAELDLMVGLDSFSVHMAERNGVKSVMLNACNHPTLWVPPLCEALSKSGGCKSHPCMNVPVCSGSGDQYICIRSISTDDVVKTVNRTLVV